MDTGCSTKERRIQNVGLMQYGLEDVWGGRSLGIKSKSSAWGFGDI